MLQYSKRNELKHVHKYSTQLRSHHKFSGASWLTFSKFHTEDPKIPDTTLHNLVSRAIWSPGFAHHCFRATLRVFSFSQQCGRGLLSSGLWGRVADKKVTEIARRRSGVTLSRVEIFMDYNIVSKHRGATSQKN